MNPTAEIVIRNLTEADIPQAAPLLKTMWMEHVDRSAYLDDLVVDPAYRGRGVGGRLIDARVDFAKSQGVTVCESKIYTYNTASKAAAEKHGFESVYQSYYRFL